MSNLIEVHNPLIKPIYTQTEPNQPIELGRVAVHFDHEGTTYQDMATVTMRFRPDDRLDILCPLDDKPPMLGYELIVSTIRKIKITLTNNDIAIDGFWTAVGGEYDGILFRPGQSGVIVTHPSDSVRRVTFHLFNFPEFFGSEDYVLMKGESRLHGWTRLGRAVLKADGWAITIAATERTDSLSKSLKSQGGYALTHVGQVTREDGAAFSSEQLEDILLCLHYFLSFSMGRWTSVALPVGFDAEGNKVFERWGMGRSADGPWNGSCSWFDQHHGELLSQVYPGFVSLWKNEIWRQTLPRALYWYLGACDRGVGIGVDTGLILAQATLELLAWTYLVLDRKIISPTKFKSRNLSTVEKLRCLMSELNIPQEIPPNLSALHENQEEKWTDGIETITRIRNSLVHPATKSNLPSHSYYEGWKLSLWYIDMILLRLCGHHGKYANRLTQEWAGQVESVPWAHDEDERQGSNG